MLGSWPAGRIQSVTDRKCDLNIVDVEGDLAQIIDALSLGHLCGEAELLQKRIGPGEKLALALGLGVCVRFGIRLRERYKVRHFISPRPEKAVMAVATVVTGALYIFKIGALLARRLTLLWRRQPQRSILKNGHASPPLTPANRRLTGARDRRRRKSAVDRDFSSIFPLTDRYCM